MLVNPFNLSNRDLFDQARVFETFRVFTRTYKAIQKNANVLKNKKC